MKRGAVLEMITVIKTVTLLTTQSFCMVDTILHKTLNGRYYYFPRLTDEEPGTLSCSAPRATELGRGPGRGAGQPDPKVCVPSFRTALRPMGSQGFCGLVAGVSEWRPMSKTREQDTLCCAWCRACLTLRYQSPTAVAPGTMAKASRSKSCPHSTLKSTNNESLDKGS